MKKSAFGLAGNSQDGLSGSHAFRPVPKSAKNGGLTESIGSASHNLRRSARMNGKPTKQNGRPSSSFQQSESFGNRSMSESVDGTEELELEKLEINPHKKKLVFLSKRVYEKARELRVTNGTNIAREILEESRKLKMNFDFKNVQRRVYDALNVLTALDMIKKDRNKIEFIKDVNEVFGEGSKDEFHSFDGKSEQDMTSRIKQLKEKKERKLKDLQAKKQYFDEITVQASLLKRLVRRNLKVEDDDTNTNTPNKSKVENVSMDKFQQTRKIPLPMLVLEFGKNADFEILMNEEQNKVVIFSDTHWNLYNDNHVLLRTGLLNDQEQENIEDLYEAEVKPASKLHILTQNLIP